MAKTLRYDGPDGFSVGGLGALENGKSYEVDDEQAKQLSEHPWFSAEGAKKPAAKKKEDA